MAATCSDIITDALRLAKVIGINRTPTSAEADMGLKCLQSMYDQWVANGMFGRLEDITLTANDTAMEGKRYFVPTGITLTVPTSVYSDGEGETRQPRDLSLYESLTEAGTRSVKLYDRTAWVELTGLTLASNAPLESRGRMGLAAALAMSGEFAGVFGDPPANVQRLGSKFELGLSYKLGSTRDRRTAEYY